MTGSAAAEFLPFFLDSDDRRLFAMAGLPAGAPARHGILVCPPFAEEMNRSRRTMRLLCAQAASRGMAVLSVDLHGTGDSSGDFRDARWTHWLADLGAGARWLAARGCAAISVLGIRAGALLAWEITRSPPIAPLADLLFWQPVLTGKAVVTDMLRTRVAAAAAGGGRESVGDLRRQLAAGRTVEAAGYALAPELVAALDAAALAPDAGRPLPVLCWVEVSSDAAGATRPPAVEMAERFRAGGARVDLLRVTDPPFWSTTEVTVGHATVAATLDWLEART